MAVDPKQPFGERTFDDVDILRNPDPGRMPDAARFHRRLALVCEVAGLDRRRLLEWTFAFALLSAAWSVEDGGEPEADFALAGLAGAALGLPNAAP